MDDEDRPLVRRQSSEPAIELVPDRELAARVRWSLEVEDRHVDPGHLVTTLPARDPVAGTHEQPMQPGIEPIRVADSPDVEPCGRERVLHGVARPIVVADDEPSGPVETRDRSGRERGERFVVAGLRLEDEVPLHATPLMEGYSFSRAAIMGIGDR